MTESVQGADYPKEKSYTTIGNCRAFSTYHQGPNIGHIPIPKYPPKNPNLKFKKEILPGS